VVCGFLLYVNASATESIVSLAPCSGDGGANVIAGGAADADAAARPMIAGAVTMARFAW
jgi:hypothetical protein